MSDMSTLHMHKKCGSALPKKQCELAAWWTAMFSFSEKYRTITGHGGISFFENPLCDLVEELAGTCWFL